METSFPPKLSSKQKVTRFWMNEWQKPFNQTCNIYKEFNDANNSFSIQICEIMDE